MKFDQLHNSRRDFIKASAVISAGAILSPASSVFAAGSETLKVALIGCGGRGKGALQNFQEAAAHRKINVEIVALADYFDDRAKGAANEFNVPAERCMVGANAYKDVMKTDAEIVLLVTPPNFRPVHFEAAVNAGKHIFMEKPVAVDPPGARKIVEMGKVAGKKGLSVAAGTQRRHQDEYLKTKYAIDKGIIGPIRAASVWWCMGQLWYKQRNPGEDDASYMIRNWVNFNEMSGDHIVEQHVHNIDVANWFIGRYPTSAVGFGGRQRRITGDQYDFFSIEFDYGDDVTVHSMCRQINGTYNRVAESFTGTTGQIWGTGRGKEELPADMKRPEAFYIGNPYVQEHVDLIDSITKKGDYLNESENVGLSTLSGIMGRISAYTGQLVRWKDLISNERSPYYNLTLAPTPADFEAGNVKAPADGVVPVPGKDA